MKFEPYKLYSMLDILGGNVACDNCDEETQKTLSPEMAIKEAKDVGWQISSPEGGKDLCPRCQKESA
jgi:hypothetical protein